MKRPHSQHQDSGAALLLAIGFVTMIGLISAGLASLATSTLNNRGSLELIRNRQYAADGAIQQAISHVRGLTCESAAGSIEDTLNDIAISVDWVNACGVVPSSTGSDVHQRNVIFSAFCKNPTDATCNFADVIIRVQVNFQDDPPKTFVQSWSVNR